MMSKHLRNSLMWGVALFSIYFLFYYISSSILYRASGDLYKYTGDMERYSWIFIYFITLFSVISYYLFKHQSDDVVISNPFGKFFIKGLIAGGILAAISSFFAPSGIGHLSFPLFFSLFVSPIYFLGFVLGGSLLGGIISLFLALNAKYKTNTNTVMGWICLFLLLPLLYSKGIDFEETALVMPIGFIVGTIVALYIKKVPQIIKQIIRKSINENLFIGKTISIVILLSANTWLSYLYFFLEEGEPNISFNNLIQMYGIPNFFILLIWIVPIITLNIAIASFVHYRKYKQTNIQ